MNDLKWNVNFIISDSEMTSFMLGIFTSHAKELISITLFG